MPSAVLAAFLLGNVPLFLYPQQHLADVSWPTHATAALPRGWAAAADSLVLLENDKPIRAQVEVVARWPDDSAKWVHVYAAYRYSGGKPARYQFSKVGAGAAQPLASPLRVEDTPQAISVDTGVLRFRVARPFAGIVELERDGQKVLDAAGGPTLIDERGILWQAADDDQAEVVIEQQGPCQVTIRASGWYQTAEERVAPFCRYVTRISAFADSPLLKIDHATIFADDMRLHAVAELGFKFSVHEVTGYASALVNKRGEEEAVSGKLSEGAAAWFAQLSSQEALVLSEAENGALEQIAAHRHSSGWFVAERAGPSLALLTKEIWQKCPKEVKVGSNELSYFAWPRHGDQAEPGLEALKLENIYKFECFLTGKLLDSRLPSSYFTALQKQTDTQECKAEYARAANLEGAAMHNEFALLVLPQDKRGAAAQKEVAAYERLYAESPIARASPARMAESGALGPVAAAGESFADVERAVHDGMLGYARSIERYADYGWSIYGNAHHEELMNPTVAGVPGGRPSLHRVWSNNHYQHISTSWQLFLLHGDRHLLDWARIATDNYASIGQVRYDALRGHTDGKGQRHPGPGVKYHNPGAFWHCKAFVPWGGRDFGMDSNDTDSGLTGHWPDPSALLMAWFVDADRWAKDGYELWLANVKFPSEGSRREINTTLVHAITAYEYQPQPETLTAIRGMGRGLMSIPLMEQRPGPLWEPTWLSRYHELFPTDEAFNKYVVASAEGVGTGTEGIWSLALSATAYRITKDEKYLRRHAGTLARAAREVFYDPAPDKRWNLYGFGPGPDRDGHFMLQWHRFRAALEEANITALPPPEEGGQYFCGVSRWDNHNDLEARGTKVLIWNEGGANVQLGIDAATLSGGDIRATALELLSPAGQELLRVPRLPMSAATPKVNRYTRPSTWYVAREEYNAKATQPGVMTLRFASDEIGVFQPISKLPECQVLRNSKLPDWSEPSWLLAKVTRGFLVPLTRGRIQLTFTAMGRSDGSHLQIVGADKRPVLSRYLRAGDSVTVTLNGRGVPPGPWLLDAFSDHSGFFKLSVTSDVTEPLLYGSNLEHVELLRQKLTR